MQYTIEYDSNVYHRQQEFHSYSEYEALTHAVGTESQMDANVYEYTNRIELLRILIVAGALSEEQSNYGITTILCTATKAGRKDVVEQLLCADLDLNGGVEPNCTALHISCVIASTSLSVLSISV